MRAEREEIASLADPDPLLPSFCLPLDPSCILQSRVYADVNEKMGRAWWDYGEFLSTYLAGEDEESRADKLECRDRQLWLPSSLSLLTFVVLLYSLSGP